jgi:hypothetical protein
LDFGSTYYCTPPLDYGYGRDRRDRYSRDEYCQ